MDEWMGEEAIACYDHADSSYTFCNHSQPKTHVGVAYAIAMSLDWTSQRLCPPYHYSNPI
ncbi:hypothetical protein [Nostoc sp.]|uniref:hypothetical protein n=1 Tax=Nostoc sp. TaxID=1180 RepID=UPI002FF59C47